MAKKFGALADFRHAQIDSTRNRGTEVEEVTRTKESSKSEPTKGRGRPAGKRSNPEYEPTTVLLRKQTKRKASRLLEDTNSENDLSDLIESLLAEWISRLS